MSLSRAVKSALVGLSTAALLMGTVGTALANGNPPPWAGRPLTATLTGAAEIPGPGDSDGSGNARVWVNAGQKRVCWRIAAASIGLPATAAHIHAAPVGVAGAVVVTLSAPGAGGAASGCTGVTRDLAGQLIQHAENYYVNVHTSDFPAGAIRGQLGKGGGAAGPAPAPQPQRTYHVTVQNLTTGQPFSAPLLVTHSGAVDVWSLGAAASEGVRLIAEDGNNAPLAATLGATSGVRDVEATGTPVHRIGGPGASSLTVSIKSKESGDRLSIVTMLICTNDGFSGLDSIVLPDAFAPVVLDAIAYDAGTETNDQLSVNIVDPCGTLGPVGLAADGNGRVATAGVVAGHAGVVAGGALTAAHVWANPVLRVTIQRII